MKIVFFVHRFWPSVGGVEKYVHRLSQALIGMGHDVSVIAGAHVAGLPDRAGYEGVPILRWPAHRSTARARWHLLRLRPLLADADVIHVSDTFMLERFYQLIGWSLPDKSVFLTRHGMSYVCPVPPLEKARARRSQHLVDGIVHDGCFIQKWLEVVPDCVPNQGLFPRAADLVQMPEPPPGRATFIGRLEPDSGIQIYFDAIRELKQTHDWPMRLDVYGDGRLAPLLSEQARRERLDVRFHGWRDDAQDRMADGCFAFVAGRMAMQEAMARKRLVVAAYVDPLKRDYVNGEPFSPYLASAGDGVSLAKIVLHYARDADARRKKVEEALNYAATLSWESTAQAYLDLWEKAPRRDRRRPSMLSRLSWMSGRSGRFAEDKLIETG